MYSIGIDVFVCLYSMDTYVACAYLSIHFFHLELNKIANYFN